MITKDEMEEAKLQAIENIKSATGTVAGAMVEERGVRAFCIGAGNSMQTAALANALHELANGIQKQLLLGLGEEGFEKLQAEVKKRTTEHVLSDRHEKSDKNPMEE